MFAKSRNRLKALAWNSSFTISLRVDNTPSFSWKTADLKLFLPFQFGEYIILAVWTKDSHKDGAFAYIGQLWKYLQLHGEGPRGDNSLIIGDFNSNIIWDRPDRRWNHSDVAKELQALGFISLYHLQAAEKQGEEICPSSISIAGRTEPVILIMLFVPIIWPNAAG